MYIASVNVGFVLGVHLFLSIFLVCFVVSAAVQYFLCSRRKKVFSLMLPISCIVLIFVGVGLAVWDVEGWLYLLMVFCPYYVFGVIFSSAIYAVQHFIMLKKAKNDLPNTVADDTNTETQLLKKEE